MSKYELSVDPRGLIFEAYRMEIGAAEARSIFLDWAVGLPGGVGPSEVEQLMARYGSEHPDHPMTEVLREGLARPPRPRGRRRRAER